MYVIQFENIPSQYIPEENLKSQSTWLVNDEETSRMPITIEAVEFHNLTICDENKGIENKWNQMKILMVFGYTLLHGVCDVPPKQEHAVPHIEEVTPEPEIIPKPLPDVVTEPVPDITPDPVPMVSKVNIPSAPPSTPECDMPLVAKPSSTSINDGIKEIYSNNMIQHKFAKIYESIDKIKSNSALVMDLIQEFKLMKTKGINVAAALPDLEKQYEELATFEKGAIEEINKINTLNKMIHDQIHALENKCVMKSKEIDESAN
jgi:hypothetical protein